MPTGAERFVAAMRAGGVDTVFGVPGEETIDLMAAIEADPGVTFVLCHHEQSAAFMASVHGRLTGQPAACLATLGPGATNLVTGVADATLDFAPMLVITGQAGRHRLRRESHQVIDLTTLFAPITKLSRTLVSADDVDGAVAQALLVARAPRPGAVHLSLPEDVAGAQSTGTKTQSARPKNHPVPPAQDVAEIARHIQKATRPVVLCGAGVVRAQAADDLRHLVQETQMPVIETFMGKGIMPPDEPLYHGVIGLPEMTPAQELLQNADLILGVGFDPIEYELSDALDVDQINMAFLGEDHIARDAGLTIQGEAVGAIGAGLRGVTAALQGWSAKGPTRARTTPEPADALPDGHPDILLGAVNIATQPEDVILSGVGNHKVWVARSVMAKRPGQMIIPNGLAGMGLALPGAQAAARLHPDAWTLAICGDGDFLMNVQEMATATRLDLDMTVCVMTDGGYGLIEKKHEADTGQTTGLPFGTVDWDALARAFGWTARHVSDRDTALKALSEARERKGRNLIVFETVYPDVTHAR